MERIGKFVLGLAFMLVVCALLAWFLVGQKTKILPQSVWNLPNLSQLQNVNLPGENLIGPQQDHKAKTLDAAKVIEWTNKYRADQGLAPLKQNDALAKAAKAKVDDMFAKQYFEHVSPDGVTPSERVLDAGYNYKVTGENLALGDFKDEKDLVDAWMASPGHRENLLNKDYTDIGVSTGLGNYQDRNTWLATQEFGHPAPNCTNPDAKLNTKIETEKAEYQKMSADLSSLADEAQKLVNESNDQINQGNQIYIETGSRTKAQPYWDKGKSLQKQSNDILDQAKDLDTQIKKLYNQIADLVNKYNSQIAKYNKCIQE